MATSLMETVLFTWKAWNPAKGSQLRFCLCFCLILGSVEAEIFYLNNGDKIEGKILQETADEIRLQIPYGTMTLEKASCLSFEVWQAQFATPAPVPVDQETLEPSAKTENRESPMIEAVSSFEALACLQFLINRQHKKTGLLVSFFPTDDFMLKEQGATYDQALAGLAFLYYDHLPEARKLGDFFVRRFKRGGFSNFYQVGTGKPGIETISHLGPNCWVSLFLLQLYSETQEKAYLVTAEKIIRWILSLPTYYGASVMSDMDENRAPWSEVVSTENNIDLFALLKLYQKVSPEAQKRPRIQGRIDKLKHFFDEVALQTDQDGLLIIYRGSKRKELDPVQALDTHSWLLLAMDKNDRKDLEVETSFLMQSLEDKFQVKDEETIGFDFTDAVERKRLERQPVVSFEWTCGVIAAYYMLAKAEDNNQQDYMERASFYLKEVRKNLFRIKSDEMALPYATRPQVQVFVDPSWWATPQDGKYLRAGSVASVAWYLIALQRNPFRPWEHWIDLARRGQMPEGD